MSTDTTSLIFGTYARERDGAGHIYHSPVEWRDPSYALSEYVSGRSLKSHGVWRRVTGPEHEAVWKLTHLSPGESWTYDGPDEAPSLRCPECGAEVWDGPAGHKLAKCWNTDGHAHGGTLAFATMGDDDEAPQWVVVENTPGYVPDDDDPATFADLDDAREYLRDAVASYVESLHAGTDWRAGYEPDISRADDGMSAYVTDPDRIYDLGRVFEILPTEDN